MHAAKSIPCPKCGSPAGASCTAGRIKKATRPHGERLEAWRNTLLGEQSLRGLAAGIYNFAKDHPCYSQASGIVQNCVDHLCAVATYHALNGKLVSLERYQKELRSKFGPLINDDSVDTV